MRRDLQTSPCIHKTLRDPQAEQQQHCHQHDNQSYDRNHIQKLFREVVLPLKMQVYFATQQSTTIIQISARQQAHPTCQKNSAVICTGGLYNRDDVKQNLSIQYRIVISLRTSINNNISNSIFVPMNDCYSSAIFSRKGYVYISILIRINVTNMQMIIGNLCTLFILTNHQ